MRVRVTRSGGFAGMTVQRDVDLSHEQIEKLRRAADAQMASPDAFSYQLSANGETFSVSGGSAEPLLEQLLRGE